MTLDELAAKFRGPVKRDAQGLTVFCPVPAHHDGAKHGRPSLRLTQTPATGGLHVRCFAECDEAAVLRAAGLTLADLAPDQRRNGHAPPHIVATYDYTDGAGFVLYQVVRFEPKSFRPRRPNGRGGWLWGLEGVRRVLYALPDLAEQRRVLVVEGEGCVDAVRALKLPWPATTSAFGADGWRPEYATSLQQLGVAEVVILPDHDPPGEQYAAAVADSCTALGLQVRVLRLPGLAPKGDIIDWLRGGHTVDALLALIEAAPAFTATPPASEPDSEPEGTLARHGFDLSLAWPDGIRFTLAAVRDGRDGVRGELTITRADSRLHWGVLPLASTSARETLRKKLEALTPEPPWAARLEDASWRFTQAAREGEPLVALTGRIASPTRELVPHLLYEGEPTLVFGDGDSGKSLFAQALAVAVHTGTPLGGLLRPTRPALVGFLDYETSRDTVEERVALLAAGLGIPAPAVLYKRMARPLVDVAAALAADFAQRRVGLVIVDSQMFALTSGDGGVHEPFTTFYGALRLFAPAASLVLNHVTGADARSGGPSRPYGGAFAYNGPRLVFELKRDRDVSDATAIAFTCSKANNLPRRPEPFGLRFTPGDGTITIAPFDLAEAAPQATAGASLLYRVRLALSRGPRTVTDLADELHAKENSIRQTLQRHQDSGTFVAVPETKPLKWSLGDRTREHTA